jgi:hypothetical protein
MIGQSGQSPSDIPTWRKHKRIELLSRRVSLSTEEHREKSAQILDSVWSMRDQITGIVGLYWPYKGEVDIRPLIGRLLDHGHPLALPVVIGRGKPLQFKSWKAGDVMAAGVYGIPYPSEGAVVEPTRSSRRSWASTKHATGWVMVAVSMIEHSLIPENKYIQLVWASKMRGSRQSSLSTLSPTRRNHHGKQLYAVRLDDET